MEGSLEDQKNSAELLPFALSQLNALVWLLDVWRWRQNYSRALRQSTLNAGMEVVVLLGFRARLTLEARIVADVKLTNDIGWHSRTTKSADDEGGCSTARRVFT